jgi:hypothetical protein
MKPKAKLDHNVKLDMSQQNHFLYNNSMKAKAKNSLPFAPGRHMMFFRPKPLGARTDVIR